MTNAIEIKGLCRAFDGFRLENVNLTIPGGTILGLIGENGAGKTTTIRCILNLMRRDAGEIQIFGRDNIREERCVKQDLGVVLDECFFHDNLRPRDVEAVLAPAYEIWDGGLYRTLLEKYDLPERKLIKEFSRGMKMKLSLAAALAHHPKLLILDEATAGLDPVVRDEILDEFLGFISDEDRAILLSSHIVGDIEKVADYITYIHTGRVALSGNKDEILERFGRVGCTAQGLEEIDRSDIVRLRRGSFGCEILTADREDFSRKYPGLTADRVTLEEIMLFIGKGERV